MNFKNSLRIIVAGLIAAVPTGAMAETVTAIVEVQVGDLNLRSDAGVRTMYKRLNAAVSQVCNPYSRSLAELQDYRRCRREAKQSIAAQLMRNDVALASTYHEKFL